MPHAYSLLPIISAECPNLKQNHESHRKWEANPTKHRDTLEHAWQVIWQTTKGVMVPALCDHITQVPLPVWWLLNKIKESKNSGKPSNFQSLLWLWQQTMLYIYQTKAVRQHSQVLLSQSLRLQVELTALRFSNNATQIHHVIIHFCCHKGWQTKHQTWALCPL